MTLVFAAALTEWSPFLIVHMETIVRHIICEPVRQAALSRLSLFHTTEIAYVAA